MAHLELPGPLVGVDWLRQHLDAPGLVIFDASWHMPQTGRDAYREWRDEHIPGSRFFDFDGRIRDPDSSLPHMLPDEEIFTRELRALGLNDDSRVVLYDSMGMFSSPRGWWMLRAMGCRHCALLDGGLVAWDEAGYPVASHADESEAAFAPGNFVARLDAALVADAAAVAAALADPAVAVVDARPAPRFCGEADEPRPGLRRGHMPGAVNLPFPELFEHGLLLPRDRLRALLEPVLAGKGRAIYSCGSGVTACILAFAADYCGYDDFAVYDGSWSEWGLPGDLPVVSD